MTVIELIYLLDQMPADVDVVFPIDGPDDGGHADITAVLYDPERDAVMLVP